MVVVIVADTLRVARLCGVSGGPLVFRVMPGGSGGADTWLLLLVFLDREEDDEGADGMAGGNDEEEDAEEGGSGGDGFGGDGFDGDGFGGDGFDGDGFGGDGFGDDELDGDGPGAFDVGRLGFDGNGLDCWRSGEEDEAFSIFSLIDDGCCWLLGDQSTVPLYVVDDDLSPTNVDRRPSNESIRLRFSSPPSSSCTSKLTLIFGGGGVNVS